MKILVVDDDKHCNEFLVLILQDEGYEVTSALSAGEAIKTASSFQPELLIADWLLKDGMDGVEMAAQLRELFPGLRIMFTTGSPAEELKDQLNGLPVVKVFEKPLEIDQLLDDIQELRAA